jgi:hypothetical protein
MHPSIGTGELAYAVGSKLMDVRTTSKETDSREEVSTSQRGIKHAPGSTVENSNLNYDSGGTPQSQERNSCSKLIELLVSKHIMIALHIILTNLWYLPQW